VVRGWELAAEPREQHRQHATYLAGLSER